MELPLQSNFSDPPGWLSIFFLALLGALFTGIFMKYENWKNFARSVAVIGGLYVFAYYGYVLQNFAEVAKSLLHFLSFFSVFALLYICSMGISFSLKGSPTPVSNVIILVTAAISACFLGSLGASLLFLRPFIRFNRSRLKIYHLAFFIFIVANIGPLPSPVGTLPMMALPLASFSLSWLPSLWAYWLLCMVVLVLLFYVIDSRHAAKEGQAEQLRFTEIRGKKNIGWLVFALLTLFIDPAWIPALPAITIDGARVSFLREVLQLTACFFCWRLADKHSLRVNHFRFDPVITIGLIGFGAIISILPFAQNLLQGQWSAQLPASDVQWFIWSGIGSLFFNNLPVFVFGSHLGAAAHLPAILLGCSVFGAITYTTCLVNVFLRQDTGSEKIIVPTSVHFALRYGLPFLLAPIVILALIFFI